jgi:hypothetical protein
MGLFIADRSKNATEIPWNFMIKSEIFFKITTITGVHFCEFHMGRKSNHLFANWEKFSCIFNKVVGKSLDFCCVQS